MPGSSEVPRHPRAKELARGFLPSGTAMAYRPYWWDSAPPRLRTEPGLPTRCDVAVAGAGYTGLSAALTLQRRGVQTVVLDAGVPGFGASTRNNGQIGSGNQKFRVKKLIELRGRDKAVAMLREGTEMLDYIARFIAEEMIDCHFARCGRFRGAMRPEHYDAMARDLDDLREAAGVDSFMVPKSRVREEVGTGVFHGGSVLPNDGSLDPGLLHAGVMRRLEAAGGLVIGDAKVSTITKENGGYRLTTARGEIVSRLVVIATNGYTGSLVPELQRKIVPVGTSTIAVGPVPEDLYARLIPKDRVYGNTNKVFYYFRGTPGRRRLLWGGRVGRLAPATSPRAYGHLARKMIEVFPDLADAPVSHAWDGLLGFTADELPHAGRTRDGLYFMLGYSGTGVSRSLYFGHKLALKILDDPEGVTAFDDLAFPDFPVPAVARRMVGVVETYYRLKDAAGY